KRWDFMSEQDEGEKRPNRKEAKQISFRVSESEYEKLKQSAETLNMSVPAFVKKKAQGARLIAPKLDKESRQAIVRDLSGIANNVNQIVKYCNAKKEKADVQAIEDGINHLKSELNEIWQRLN